MGNKHRKSSYLLIQRAHLGVVLWSGYAISLIWGEKRCVSDMFDINAFRIVGKCNSMLPKFCGIKYLWTIFMTGQKQSFSERTYFWRNITLDVIVWGKIWNALILVDNNVFVLQATQSIDSPNLEASRLQVNFLQHVKLHVKLHFDGTPTSKIWLCGTEKLTRQLQSFYPNCLELGWEFINKIPLIILFI